MAACTSVGVAYRFGTIYLTRLSGKSPSALSAAPGSRIQLFGEEAEAPSPTRLGHDQVLEGPGLGDTTTPAEGSKQSNLPVPGIQLN